MEIIDANVIIRYLLKDDENLFKKSVEIVEKRFVYLPFEVFAEVVYVLEKVYQIPRKNIESTLTALLNYENIALPDISVIKSAIKIYSREKVDIVDAIMIGYNQVHGYKVHTFDKHVNKRLK